jgi:hypothetical protein
MSSSSPSQSHQFDDTLSLPRKLTSEESVQLQERLRPFITASQSDEDDFVSDLFDYAVAMVSNSKSIRYVVDNLIGMEMEFCNSEVAERIGKEIHDYIINAIRLEASSSTEASKDSESFLAAQKEDVTSHPNIDSPDSHKARIAVIKAKPESNMSGNALTMSGALGSTREGGRVHKNVMAGNNSQRNQISSERFKGINNQEGNKKNNIHVTREAGNKKNSTPDNARKGSNLTTQRDHRGRAFDRLVSGRGGQTPSSGDRGSGRNTNDERRENGSGREVRRGGGGRGQEDRRGRGEGDQRFGERAAPDRRDGGRGRGSENRGGRGTELNRERGNRNSNINSRGERQMTRSGGRDHESDVRSGRHANDRGGGRPPSFDDTREHPSESNNNRSIGNSDRREQSRGSRGGDRSGPRSGRGGERSGRTDYNDHLSGNRRGREPSSRNMEEEMDFVPTERNDRRDIRQHGRGGDGRGRFDDSARVTDHNPGHSGRHPDVDGRNNYQGRGRSGSNFETSGDGGYHANKRFRKDDNSHKIENDSDGNVDQNHAHNKQWDGELENPSANVHGGWHDAFHSSGRGRGGYHGSGRSGRGFAGRSNSWYANSERQQPAEVAEAPVSIVASAGAAHPSPIVAAAANSQYPPSTYHAHGGFYPRGRGRGRGRGSFSSPLDVQSILASKTWVRNKEGGDTGGEGDA